MKKTVILISGKMYSGKNQVATYIKEILDNKYEICETSFAKKLKENCVEDFDSLLNMLRDKIANFKSIYKRRDKKVFDLLDFIRIPDKDKLFEDKTPIVRKLYQIYGSKIFRDRVNTNYWIGELKETVKQSKADFILVTDCRFPNEIEEMNDDDFDIITLRLTRDINTNIKTKNHISEIALDDWLEWDYIVDNSDGNLKKLKESIETVIKDVLKIRNL